MSDASPRERERDARKTGAGDSLSLSDRFDLLASDRRRCALRYLSRRPDTRVSVEEVANHASAVGLGAKRNVELALQHVHLPKLDDAGIVAYDPERGTVEYRGDEGIEELLAFVSD